MLVVSLSLSLPISISIIKDTHVCMQRTHSIIIWLSRSSHRLFNSFFFTSKSHLISAQNGISIFIYFGISSGSLTNFYIRNGTKWMRAILLVLCVIRIWAHRVCQSVSQSHLGERYTAGWMNDYGFFKLAMSPVRLCITLTLLPLTQTSPTDNENDLPWIFYRK